MPVVDFAQEDPPNKQEPTQDRELLASSTTSGVLRQSLRRNLDPFRVDALVTHLLPQST